MKETISGTIIPSFRMDVMTYRNQYPQWGGTGPRFGESGPRSVYYSSGEVQVPGSGSQVPGQYTTAVGRYRSQVSIQQWGGTGSRSVFEIVAALFLL